MVQWYLFFSTFIRAAREGRAYIYSKLDNIKKLQ